LSCASDFSAVCLESAEFTPSVCSPIACSLAPPLVSISDFASALSPAARPASGRSGSFVAKGEWAEAICPEGHVGASTGRERWQVQCEAACRLVPMEMCVPRVCPAFSSSFPAFLSSEREATVSQVASSNANISTAHSSGGSVAETGGHGQGTATASLGDSSGVFGDRLAVTCGANMELAQEADTAAPTIAELRELGHVILWAVVAFPPPAPTQSATLMLPGEFALLDIRIPAGAWDERFADQGPSVAVFSFPGSVFAGLARRSSPDTAATLAGKAIHFGPSGAAFRRAVTISLPVDSDVMSTTDFSTHEILVHEYLPAERRLVPIATSLQAGGAIGVARAETTHFSAYVAVRVPLRAPSTPPPSPAPSSSPFTPPENIASEEGSSYDVIIIVASVCGAVVGIAIISTCCYMWARFLAAGHLDVSASQKKGKTDFSGRQSVGASSAAATPREPSPSTSRGRAGPPPEAPVTLRPPTVMESPRMTTQAMAPGMPVQASALVAPASAHARMYAPGIAQVRQAPSQFYAAALAMPRGGGGVPLTHNSGEPWHRPQVSMDVAASRWPLLPMAAAGHGAVVKTSEEAARRGAATEPDEDPGLVWTRPARPASGPSSTGASSSSSGVLTTSARHCTTSTCSFGCVACRPADTHVPRVGTCPSLP